ncbi:MAG: hypothetical protein LQ343_007731 [Gyalolechia ehrenbergii]|nr:MAG: hypothetical protein LQ343_007731 [Gyalolechia ehrenbergii]
MNLAKQSEFSLTETITRSARGVRIQDHATSSTRSTAPPIRAADTHIDKDEPSFRNPFVLIHCNHSAALPNLFSANKEIYELNLRIVTLLESFRSRPLASVTSDRVEKPTVWCVDEHESGVEPSVLWENTAWLGLRIAVLMAERARKIRIAVVVVGKDGITAPSDDWRVLHAGICMCKQALIVHVDVN